MVPRRGARRFETCRRSRTRPATCRRHVLGLFCWAGVSFRIGSTTVARVIILLDKTIASPRRTATQQRARGFTDSRHRRMSFRAYQGFRRLQKYLGDQTRSRSSRGTGLDSKWHRSATRPCACAWPSEDRVQRRLSEILTNSISETKRERERERERESEREDSPFRLGCWADAGLVSRAPKAAPSHSQAHKK
ncbi:hypothetical protein LX32DRAFT_294234 [Colletotrichum zoysiae]|uniref:Uncharacterized protein n=1 Tax=Colletotrichum zoysiae TaxID=1216348 RepID=A0AAD9HLJ1_9PEZI|nr:hypothetical protein LX32DRAFT_294234 [Colletotrichum zoysiae]